MTPGRLPLSFFSSSHSGAGAQDLTTTVFRLASSILTRLTASSASRRSFLPSSTAACPFSFSSILFLPRVNSGTPKLSSRLCMARVTDGVEM